LNAAAGLALNFRFYAKHPRERFRTTAAPPLNLFNAGADFLDEVEDVDQRAPDYHGPRYFALVIGANRRK
jgi:hypothetical protein